MPNEHCQSVRDRLGAYATDDLNESEQAEIEAHLASCPECAAHVERLRRTAASLVPLRDEIADRKLSAERRRQIIDGEALSGTPSRWNWRRWFAYHPALRWAAAAGVAVVAGLATFLWTSPSRNATQMAARKSVPSAEEASAVAEIVSESDTRHRMKEAPDLEAVPQADQDAPQAEIRSLPLAAQAPDQPRPSAASKSISADEKLSEDAAKPSLRPASIAKSAKPGQGRTEEAEVDEVSYAGEREERKRVGETTHRKPRPESARRVMETLEFRSAAGAIAQPPLADVVAVPSPFRDQHVLLGVRATHPIDRLSAASKTFGHEARDYDSDKVAPRIVSKAEKREETETKQQAPQPQPMPVRIRFNEQNVRSQRQIAGRRTREDGKTRRSAEFDAVYEVALEAQTAANREDNDKVHDNNQLNVATLETDSPQRQQAQQINISTQQQASQDTSQLRRTAQAQPELYLDACENELERLTDKSEADSKSGRQTVLRQIQTILQAVAEVRPEGPRTQTLLDRVNRQLVSAKPTANPPAEQ